MSDQNIPSDNDNEHEMTFWDHLDELRKVLVRIVAAALLFGCVVLLLKDQIFKAILAPTEGDFITYRLINRLLEYLGMTSMLIPSNNITLINTELAAQFMTHISVSFIIGLLATAPYIIYQLFLFIKPALYDNERRNSGRILTAVVLLFYLGVVVDYFVIFPISVRFLGTYQVDPSVANTITLSSYISTFTTLSLMMGVVFEVPVLVYFLTRMGIISSALLKKYRRHSFIVILIISAIITPPDVFTLILMCLPLYGLYEVGIVIARRVERRKAALQKEE